VAREISRALKTDDQAPHAVRWALPTMAAPAPGGVQRGARVS